MIFRRRKPVNRWKGLVLGIAGGAAGALAMSAYWQLATQIEGKDPRKTDVNSPPDTLDSISLLGNNHRPGESSTAALGRVLYTAVTGSEPSDEMKNALSYALHWLFSTGFGAAYGFLRPRADAPDLVGGVALGTTVFLMGDELAMPAMGFADGPTAYPLSLHLHSFGAHLAYGIASAAVTQALHQVIE
jgi:uncharacterized membrane protein YagU involved in acid resistance